MPTIQELQQQIQEVEKNRQSIKKKITSLKKKLVENESDLIEATLQQERLIEQLRVARYTTVSLESSERDKEIEGFRSRHPEWCPDRVKNNED
jgi:chromosome segregation ATPase